MSWEKDLFAMIDDLEQEAAAVFAAEREVEVADRARAVYAEVSLASRMMATADREVTVRVRGVGAVPGVLRRVGADWCLLRSAGQDWVVPLEAVAWVRGASDRAVPEVAWRPACRLGLGAALRRLAASGERCVLHQLDGDRMELVLSRVGSDFVEGTVVDGGVVLVRRSSLAAVHSRAEDD